MPFGLQADHWTGEGQGHDCPGKRYQKTQCRIPLYGRSAAFELSDVGGVENEMKCPFRRRAEELELQALIPLSKPSNKRSLRRLSHEFCEYFILTKGFSPSRFILRSVETYTKVGRPHRQVVTSQSPLRFLAMNDYGFERWVIKDRCWKTRTTDLFQTKTRWTTSVGKHQCCRTRSGKKIDIAMISAYLPGLPGKQKEKDNRNRRPSCFQTYSTSMSPITCSGLQTYEEVHLPAGRSLHEKWPLKVALSQTMVIKILKKKKDPAPFPFQLVDRLRENSPSDSKTVSNGWPWNWKNRMIFLIILMMYIPMGEFELNQPAYDVENRISAIHINHKAFLKWQNIEFKGPNSVRHRQWNFGLGQIKFFSKINLFPPGR